MGPQIWITGVNHNQDARPSCDDANLFNDFHNRQYYSATVVDVRSPLHSEPRQDLRFPKLKSHGHGEQTAQACANALLTSTMTAMAWQVPVFACFMCKIAPWSATVLKNKVEKKLGCERYGQVGGDRRSPCRHGASHCQCVRTPPRQGR